MEIRNTKFIIGFVAGVLFFSMIGGVILLYQKDDDVVEESAQSEEERIKNEKIEKIVQERVGEFLKTKVNECFNAFPEEKDWDLTLLQSGIEKTFYVKNILPIINSNNQESCADFNKWQAISNSFTEKRCAENVNVLTTLNLLVNGKIDEFSINCREKIAIEDNKDEPEAVSVICNYVKDSFLQKNVVFNEMLCDDNEISDDMDTCEYETGKSCKSGICSIIKYAVAIAKNDISLCNTIASSRYKVFCQFYFDKTTTLNEIEKNFKQEYCSAKISQKAGEYMGELRKGIKDEMENIQ